MSPIRSPRCRLTRIATVMALALALTTVARDARAYETAWAFVYPVGTEYERPTTSSSNPNGYWITQGFCVWNTSTGSYHLGVDLLNGSEGGTVRACANGVVKSKLNSSSWGHYLRIEHRLSDGSIVYSMYAHMQSASTLVVGETVQMGEPIGKVGNTGSSSAPHLHFQIRNFDSDVGGYGSSCSGNYDPIQFVADRFLGQATTNAWWFGTNGQKEGWNTLPYEQAWSVGSSWLIENLGQDTRIYSPYMNRTPNDKIYVKFNMANQSACGVGQFYLQTTTRGFNTEWVKHFAAPKDGHWGTVVIPMGEVPGWSGNGNWRRFRIQLPGNCASGNWYFDYIRYVTDNVAPIMQTLTISPLGWSTSNSFTASWSAYDGPDDGTGYGSGVKRYEISVNGGAWQDVGLNTTWTVSASTCANTLQVRAVDNVENVGAAAAVDYHWDAQAPPTQSAYVIQTGWRNVNSFTFSWQPVNDGCCSSGYEYHRDSEGWQPTSSSALTLAAYRVGENSFQVRGVDCAGNRGGEATVLYYFDDQPPARPTIAASPSGYTNINQFTLSWVPPSDVGAGIAGYEYWVGGSAPTWTTSTSVAGALAYQQGINSWGVRARDHAGNWSEWANGAFYFDDVNPPSPVVAVSPTGCARVNDFDFVWTPPSDPNGISGYEYRIGSGTGVQTTATHVDGLVASRECADTMFVRARDTAGNWGHWGFVAFCLDTTPPPTPAATSTPARWTASRHVALTWASVDDACADAVSYCVTVDPGPDSCSADTSRTAIDLQTEADHVLALRSVDPAGNRSVPAIFAVGHDATAPLAGFRSPVGVASSDGIPVTWWGSDGLSGVASFDIQFRDSLAGTWQDWILGTTDTTGTFGPTAPTIPVAGHSYFLRVRARDQAGNTGAFDGEVAVLRFPLRAQMAWTDITPAAMQSALPWRGVAWGDYDADGLPDVCVTTGGQGARLFHNEGGGAFVGVNVPSLDSLGDCRAAVWGDYDRDLDLDLYVCVSTGGRLYRNDGTAGFRDATPAALAVASGTSAAWVDFDRDGWLDLTVGTEGAGLRLFRGTTFSTFEDVTHPPFDASSNCRGAAWSDLDLDGLPDLYVARWQQSNRLYHNQGMGGFGDATDGPLGYSGQSNSVSWGDLDGDGDPDLLVTELSGSNRLFRNDGPAGFVEATPESLALVEGSVGAACADFDRDGHLDVYVASDGVDGLFRNAGGGWFERVRGSGADEAAHGRGVAWADVDGDGDPDLLVANAGAPCRLLRNDSGTSGHWLRVVLRGILSNVSGIGARVTIHQGGGSQVRELAGGSGYYGQDECVALFGSRLDGPIDSLTVDWPSGIHQVIDAPAPDNTVLVTEGVPTAAPPAPVVPGAFALGPARPNPMSTTTSLTFDLPSRSRISAGVYDVTGRRVRSLVESRELDAGRHRLEWDGADDSGSRLQSGIYFMRLVGPTEQRTCRVILLGSGR